MKLFGKKQKPAETPRPRSHLFSTHMPPSGDGGALQDALAKTFKVNKVSAVDASGQAIAMDSIGIHKNGFGFDSNYGMPENIALWYGSQSFLGYQLCAMLAQNWLIDKACTMPARDAVRGGFELSVPEGIEVDPDKLAALKDMDKRMDLMGKMVEFVRFCRIFGIRIAMFEVESTDPEYYLKPFNIDGVKKGSYKGIVQIDPYWITPELDQQAAANPASLHFYEPTWWRINGQRVHRSHLVVIKTGEVADILKPTYFYGGVSIPQKIYERVYCAERTANEAPLLALTKRTTTFKTDLSMAEANPDKFLTSMTFFANYRDNMGVKIIGDGDEMEQFDTSLADLDAAIMTQYQIVSAASDVPATKLLGTSPKGFNASGEYEEQSYHEMLESVQEHDLTRLVNRHHELCIKSEISPDAPFPVVIAWNPLDVSTEKELAEINQLKAQTGTALSTMGAIDGEDERSRITLDKNSGYANLPSIDRDVDQIEGNEDDGDDEPAADEKA